MIRLRRSLLSERTRREAKGQVATFFIILMVIILIAAMFISNLGQVSERVVEVANAADASTLSLGSQLATMGNQICAQISDPVGTCSAKSNEGVKQCRRTGLLGVVLAVIVSLIVIVATGGTATPLVVAYWGAGAGAVGGAIATRSWKGTAMGAAQGFMIGYGMGSFTQSFSGLPTNPTGPLSGTTSEGFIASSPMTGTATLTAGAPAITGITVGASNAAVAVGPLIGATALAGGGEAMRQSIQDHAASEGIKALSKALNTLPDYERLRENTFLQALAGAVNDPNRTVGPNGGAGCFFPGQYGPAVGDPFDVDGDGDRSESISCFDYWWSVRINTLAAPGANREALITSFMEGPANFVPGQPLGQSLRDRLTMAWETLDYIERNEVECACLGSGPVPSEGPTVEVFRRLDSAGYGNAALFQPGPAKGEVQAFYNDPCEPSCPAPPAGWDSIDAVKMQYEDFIIKASALVYNPLVHGPKGFGSKEAWYAHLARTVDAWLPMLYDPESTVEMYDQLAFIGGEIGGWFLWLRDTVAPSLPMCKWYRGGHPLVFSGQPEPGPMCPNTQLVPDPAGGPQMDLDPIYPCTYENTSAPNANMVNSQRFLMDNYDPDTDPPNFPGPICKIDWNDRELMFKEMDAMADFVKSPNLEEHILDDPERHFDEAYGEAPCDAPEDEVVTDEGEVEVTLNSIDEVGFIQWGGSGPLNPPQLRYVYTYEYQCCVGPCASATDTYTKEIKDKEGAEPFPGYVTFATQMRRKETGDFPSAQASFIAVMDAYRNTLRAMRIGPPHNRFVSTDFDVDHTGDDVPDNEFAEAVGGFMFIANSEPYFFDTDSNSWAGVSGIQFFLLNLQNFYDQLKNSVLTKQAEDGRLPNPEQEINDPIRGGVHQVDGLYEWQDSAGVHRVDVTIGPFIKPKTETKKSGNFLIGKTCIEMKDYCDNTPGCPYRGLDRTWVRIERRDPVGKDIGLWKWNPFPTTIRKTARAAYDRRDVRICGTSGVVQCP